MITREPVASSNVASVGYDEQSETLEVEFLNGTVYQYFNVGMDLYEQFRAAPSKGQFLNAYIRKSYPYSRVG
jgi:hypothetical protein